jgi:hypothetical protein
MSLLHYSGFYDYIRNKVLSGREKNLSMKPLFTERSGY